MGALSKLKVLDFSTLLPGPYATMCLADLGADVMRIYSASRAGYGDDMEPYVLGSNIPASAAYLGRNKKSMNLNLKNEYAKEVISRLIKEQGYDIVVEQFRPGVMDKLGFGYEDLKRIKPDIIYCSITGYGQDGPMATRAGHDINYIARSGVVSYSGKKGSPPPLFGMQIADIAAGSYNAVIGILASIIYRNSSGKGQYVDVSMTDGMMAFNAFLGANYLTDTVEPKQEDNFVNGGSLYDYYETKEGKFISFGGLEQKFFANFCDAIGRTDLIAGGIVPKDMEKTRMEVAERIKTKTRDEWMEIFNSTDACVEPVMGLKDLEDDELTKTRAMIVEVPFLDSTVKQFAHPIKYSETSAEYRSIGTRPADGVDTQDIMKKLGYTEVEIHKFTDTGLFK